MRHEADVDAADARGRIVQQRIAVPALGDIVAHGGDPAGESDDVAADLLVQAAPCDTAPSPTFTSGRLAAFSFSPKTFAGRDLGKIGNVVAEIVIAIGEVGVIADDRDRRAPGAPGLADARIEHRRFLARIGADVEDGIGFLDAGNGRG